MRLLTLKVIQPDETSTALSYYSNRKGCRYHAIKSPSGIINNTICKKKTKIYPPRCFNINHELQKRKKEKMVTGVFYRKTPS